MTREELQDIFESEFKWDNWKKVMNFVFPEFKFNLAKTNLPLDTQAKEKNLHSIVPHGQGQLASHESLMLFEVLVKDNIRLDRNVKSVRSFVASESIPNFQTIVAVFHNADNTKWRFTLVVKELTEENKLKDKKPESYTYVFGVGEKGRTASERFLKLANNTNKRLKDLEEAFSVEALSKEFFKEYKEGYQLFVNDIINNSSRLALFKENSLEKQKKSARDFVKKMMGRLVFLYFLQKKGWLGCKTKWKKGDEAFMNTFVEKAKKDDQFYFQFLEPLFFETLNAKRAKQDEDCVIQKIPFGKVPYLNGGLFEKDEHHPTGLTLTWANFEAFFETLNSYNFTIIEDDPEFKEVAVDPEMLGHIFENLLEDNNDKGAFYTPKEIVHYMCQESLYEYLKTYLQQNNHWPQNELDIQQLEKSLQRFVKLKLAAGVIDYDKPLARALKEVKVCDPAIGSGAFPMGLLNEIYHCVHKLHDESPDKVGDVWDIGKIWQGNKVKLNIIQNSIYGVDIEKGAVDIARLRFWLSLIVDETEPKPLPNLDFKIVVGDSLLPKFENDVVIIDWNLKIDSYEDTDQSKLKKQITKDQIENLNKVAHKQKEYFNTDESKKEKVLTEIQILKLEILLGQVKQELIKIGKQKEAFGQTGLFSSTLSKKQIEIQEKELKLKHLEKRITKKISTKNTDFIHFDWRLDFPEILNDLLVDKPGFDIVIGNPPYFQLQKVVEYSNDLEQVNFKTFIRSGDVYCLFYERGVDLLKKDGVLAFITSNSWMKTQYGEALRKYLVDESNPLTLLNFEDTKIFPTATVEVNILVTAKTNFTNSLNAVAIRPDYSDSISIADYFKNNSVTLEDLNINGWLILSKQDNEIKTLIEKNSSALKNFSININFGIKTGLNEAFIIDKEIKDQLIQKDPNNKKIIREVLRGRDLKKYAFGFGDKWIIISPFKKHEELIENYPSVYQFLSQFEQKLKARGQVRNEQHHWLELDNNPTDKYFSLFDKPKIMWGELSDKPKFSYDMGGYYAEATVFIMTGDNLKYLLSILNSRLASWYFNQITTTSGMGTNRWKKYKIEQLPIANPREVEKFEIIVDYLIYLNNPSNPAVNQFAENIKLAPIFEDVLNMMVYELYFEEHMKEEKIDVLNCVDTKNIFLNISSLKSESEIKVIINNAYSKLQEQDNLIRNRIIASNLKSESIIRRINSTTH